MAALTTIAVVLGAWCAASVITAALYSALRCRQVRRQRELASYAGVIVGRYAPAPRAAAGPSSAGCASPQPGRPQRDLSLRF
ncbi:hypothetical protein ACFWUZ_12425 [Streptomyces sp. NPDC058646]|uniref:hypothetical protein n=1 Tax=Streptomyces sp. NPDC058646 TaxID=3346574 RepID=UPI00364955A3